MLLRKSSIFLALLTLIVLSLSACKPAAPAEYSDEEPAEDGAYPSGQESQPSADAPAPTADDDLYIRIDVPANGASVQSGIPLTVSGMGAGVFEGTVVVQVLDAAGNELIKKATIIQSPEAGVGGEGPWEIELLFTVDAPTEGKIMAFSPSPKDGSPWLASDEIMVTLNPAVVDYSLENTPWLLSSFAPDDEDNVLAGIYQGTATFAPETNQISGITGCNNYNTSYTAADGALTINTPIALTRKMCTPGPMTLENKFVAALEQVAGYDISGKILTMYDAKGAPILTFQVDPYTLSTAFTRESLGNIAYLSEFGENGAVQLSNGQYHAQATDGSASQVSVFLSNFAAFGDLNGDGMSEAAVILISSGGGSGTFYDLAVVSKDGNTLTNIAVENIGDRIQIQDIKIENMAVVISATTHAPEDPICCPSQHSILYYGLNDNQLVHFRTEADK